MDAVWPGTAVEENNLTVQISALRRVWIKVAMVAVAFKLRRCRGYRFLPAVARVDEALAHGAAQPGQPSTPTGRRIKVDHRRRLLPDGASSPWRLGDTAPQFAAGRATRPNQPPGF